MQQHFCQFVLVVDIHKKSLALAPQKYLMQQCEIQYFWNSLDHEVTPFGIPETTTYYDSEGEVCLLNESDLSLLAQLEKLS